MGAKKIFKKSILSVFLVNIMIISLFTQVAFAAITWPTLQNGSSGVNVYALQYLLNNQSAGITVDGTFGPGTTTAVKNFQTSKGLTSDGIVGQNTWSKLCVTTQQGSNNNAVKAVQYLLKNKYSLSLTVDGIFGSGTYSAVVAFQKAKGLTQNGIVDLNTWNYLIGSSSQVISPTTPTTPPSTTSDINNIWDSYTRDRIKKLQPKIQNDVVAFIIDAQNQGIKVRITDGFRSYAEQDALYAQGRTTSGSIVTNAKAGQSWHNFGLAIDVVEIVNGAAQYTDASYAKIAVIGKQHGFVWGGDWTSFKDKPHFEKTYSYTLSQLDARVKAGYVNSSGLVTLP